MFYGAKKSTFINAKKLRRKTTVEEKLLWNKLSNRLEFPEKWRRQHPISFYVADFYCHKYRLIIEVDGKDHDRKVELDQLRTENLNGLGIEVIRFKNEEVLKNIDSVVDRIKFKVKESAT